MLATLLVTYGFYILYIILIITNKLLLAGTAQKHDSIGHWTGFIYIAGKGGKSVGVMASQRVLLAFAVVVVVAGVLAAPSALAADLLVGDSQGWGLNIDYDTWVDGNDFFVGNTLGIYSLSLSTKKECTFRFGRNQTLNLGFINSIYFQKIIITTLVSLHRFNIKICYIINLMIFIRYYKY